LTAYQILEAKAIGADLILLIAACLSVTEVKNLSAVAKSLGLEVLLEIHDESELNHICTAIDFVGINNRNLKTFSVDLSQSILLQNKIGKDYFTISESGIQSITDVLVLKKEGFHGFLIGELFMKQPNPAKYFMNFMQQLNKQYENS
jgi:indole-3-glycerol phosphate synthase